MAEEVTGAERLAEAVRHTVARNGWKQTDLERRSRKEMAAEEDSGRSRIGLSERTWQEIWQGRKTYEMELYSYTAIDRTLGWTKGTAWALHHGEEPPTMDDDRAAELEARIETIETKLANLTDIVLSRRLV